MVEVVLAIAGLMLAALYLAAPFFAIAAWRRTRRLEDLEARLRQAERRLALPRDAAWPTGPAADRPGVHVDSRPVFDLPQTAAEVEPPRPAVPPSAPGPPPLPHVVTSPRHRADDVGWAAPASGIPAPAATERLPHTAGEPGQRPAPRRRPRAPWGGGWSALGSAWDERLGGSVLSKAGALLVVIGVSLFVGWSMVHMGPVGRVAIAATLSGLLLATGLVFERWPDYRSVALGLSAAGWGGLYVTAYAMHGLEAARVIDDPTTALTLLLAVAAGMIVHAVRLAAPMLVAVAYAAAFAAVALGPASASAATACVVLAGTLLAVAYRRDWGAFAVGGLLCTYGTLAFRLPPAGEVPGGWWLTTGHALIWTCWLLFEAYDILTAARGVQSGPSRSLMPLNLCGLLAVALLHWPADRAGYDVFLAAAAAAYAASTLCRIGIGRRLRATEVAAARDEGLAGNADGSISIATVLWGVALWMRFGDGWRLHVGLLMEAEFLFLAGVAFGQRHLRMLAAAVFAVLLVRFVALDVPPGGEITIAGVTLAAWTPSALLAAVVLAVNRVIIARTGTRPLLAAEQGSTYAATALVAAVIGGEALQRHVGLGPEMLGFAWLVQAWILVQIAVGFRMADAYRQAVLLAVLAVVPLVLVNAFGLVPVAGPAGGPPAWLWLVPALLLLHAMAWRVTGTACLAGIEPAAADVGGAGLFAAAALAIVVLWHSLPAPLVALGWGGYAVASFHLGLRLPHAGLRWHAYLAVALTVGRLFLANFTNAGLTGGISHRLLTVVPVILMLYAFAWRLSDAELRPAVARSERRFGLLCAWAAAAVLVLLLRFELGRVLAVVGWAVVGVVLLVVGTRRSAAQLRWQSHAIALLTFARSWGTHFAVPDAAPGLPLEPWMLGGVVVASLFGSEFLCPPDAGAMRPPTGPGGLLAWLDAHRRTYYCILGTVLLGILLVHEVPASFLTAALGIEGAGLLALGFIRPDRALRTCGLAVLGICIPKLFFHDLRHLETPYRILSFLLLGILLIAASWVYTRFKSRLRGVV